MAAHRPRPPLPARRPRRRRRLVLPRKGEPTESTGLRPAGELRDELLWHVLDATMTPAERRLLVDKHGLMQFLAG